jgi:putative tricarboxylic transport membrane protein
VGIDPVVGAPRFTYGQTELLDGFGVVPVVMGLFGIAEILLNVESRAKQVFDTPTTSLMLTKEDVKASTGPIARGTVIGFFLGLVPGLGSMIPTFVSYSVEKNLSRTPERFGQGAIEGVAGPETANNAYANAALIPLFTLGIPSSPTTAVLAGAFMINGLVPGPTLFTEHAPFVWAVIASLYVGNLILLILNIPFIPLWVRLLKIPYSMLIAIILGFCVIGAYSLSNSAFDVVAMLAFGIVGYLFKKVDIPAAPLVLTFVLGPLMERGLRQSLEMSEGDFSIFFTRPISGALLAVAAIVIVTSTLQALRAVRGADSEV